MPKTPTVGIVVLNWNNAPDTLKCLQSLSKLRYDRFFVDVVDNGSTDGSVELIRSRFPRTGIVQLPSNIGFAAANNTAIRNVFENGVDYALLLNNDTLVASTMLAKLVQFAEDNSDAGLVGPAMYYMNPSNRVFAAGGVIGWVTGETFHRDKLSKSPEIVDYIPGCGLLVKRAAFERAGGMDPEYFLNFEDVEWALRIRRSGYTVWCVPQARLWHKVSATLGPASPQNTYYMTRNSLRFFWRNAPGHFKFSAMAAIGARTVRTILAWQLKRKYRPDFERHKRANMMALRDFILGRYGKMGPDVATVCR